MVELLTAICLIVGAVVVAKALWGIFGSVLSVIFGICGVILMVFFLGPLFIVAGLAIYAVYKLLTPSVA